MFQFTHQHTTDMVVEMVDTEDKEDMEDMEDMEDKEDMVDMKNHHTEDTKKRLPMADTTKRLHPHTPTSSHPMNTTTK
jgi:hypothetical protein